MPGVTAGGLSAGVRWRLRAGTPAHALLVSWLETRPGAELVEMWRRYVRTMSAALTEHARGEMRERMIGMARGVAEAAGGFLGLGNTISPAEQAVLEDLAATLG